MTIEQFESLALENKCEVLWTMAFDQCYYINGDIRPDMDWTYSHCFIFDFMPKLIDNWLKGRMSLFNQLNCTPDKVDALLITHFENIIKIQNNEN